jgi:hypothetical protein
LPVAVNIGMIAPMVRVDLAGQDFHSLSVLHRAPQRQNTRSTYWVCRCECGTEIEVESVRLRNGRTKSCGCQKRQFLAASSRVHGGYANGSMAPALISWCSMIQRCTNPRANGYERYGGRGITVCRRWRRYENFLSDMGERPNGTTLDRIDGRKGYSPSNCRWATPSQQQQNLKNSRHVAIAGEKMTIRECASKYALAYQALRTALYAHGVFHIRGDIVATLLPLAR